MGGRLGDVMGCINMERMRPTPKVGKYSNANSKSEPAAMTCSCGMSSLKKRSARRDDALPSTSPLGARHEVKLVYGQLAPPTPSGSLSTILL